MRQFTDSRSCACRLHCPTCRDLEGGRKRRGSLAEHFALPGGEIDFDCPHGIPWGAGPQIDLQDRAVLGRRVAEIEAKLRQETPRERAIREMRNGRFQTCKACKDDCAMHHKTDCELRARLARPLFWCPRDHFKMVDIDQRVRQLKEAEGASK